MAGFDRYNNVLNLFTKRASSWTVAEISEQLKSPASTVYRNVRELVAAGYLESAAGSYFRLGPAFLELDRTIQMTDPLIRSGVAFLAQLTSQTPIPCVAVLARLYGSKVMCVADARSANFQRDTSYQRGRPMPIDKGATSRAILAQMSESRVKRLLKEANIKESGTTSKLMSELKAIHIKGVSITRGEVDQGLVGYAVPLRNKALGISASLSCIFVDAGFSSDHEPEVFALLTSFARLIENHMQSSFDDLAKAHDKYSANDR
jgi:DNA-binding IclR family transcriptional regulator